MSTNTIDLNDAVVPFNLVERPIPDPPKKFKRKLIYFYSDRMITQDINKYERLCQKIFGDTKQVWDIMRGYSDTEQLIKEFYNLTDLKLREIKEEQNYGLGFPIWKFKCSIPNQAPPSSPISEAQPSEQSLGKRNLDTTTKSESQLSESTCDWLAQKRSKLANSPYSAIQVYKKRLPLHRHCKTEASSRILAYFLS
ncbi:MAG: hypothetical protein ACPGUD_01530 [Parashewanella sp.]